MKAARKRSSKPDPIIAKLKEHRKFWRIKTDDTEEFEAAQDASMRPWNDLLEMVPTTMAGTLALADHLLEHLIACGHAHDDAEVRWLANIRAALSGVNPVTHVRKIMAAM